MNKFYHTTGRGLVFGPFVGNLADYQKKLRDSYGSLRGILICNAENLEIAERKLLYREKMWDGQKWKEPLKLIDNNK